MSALLIHAAMLLLGLAAHYLKELARIRSESGKVPRFTAYWTEYPYQTGLSVVGALAGFFTLHEAGQLTAITAFGIGYMADSAADILGKRAAGKIQ